MATIREKLTATKLSVAKGDVETVAKTTFLYERGQKPNNSAYANYEVIDLTPKDNNHALDTCST